MNETQNPPSPGQNERRIGDNGTGAAPEIIGYPPVPAPDLGPVLAYIRERVPAWAAWPPDRMEEFVRHAHDQGCLHVIQAAAGTVEAVTIAWPLRRDQADDEWPIAAHPTPDLLRVDLWAASTLRGRLALAFRYLRHSRLPIRCLRHGREHNINHAALVRLWQRQANTLI